MHGLLASRLYSSRGQISFSSFGAKEMKHPYAGSTCMKHEQFFLSWTSFVFSGISFEPAARCKAKTCERNRKTHLPWKCVMRNEPADDVATQDISLSKTEFNQASNLRRSKDPIPHASLLPNHVANSVPSDGSYNHRVCLHVVSLYRMSSFPSRARLAP